MNSILLITSILFAFTTIYFYLENVKNNNKIIEYDLSQHKLKADNEQALRVLKEENKALSKSKQDLLDKNSEYHSKIQLLSYNILKYKDLFNLFITNPLKLVKSKENKTYLIKYDEVLKEYIASNVGKKNNVNEDFYINIPKELSGVEWDYSLKDYLEKIEKNLI